MNDLESYNKELKNIKLHNVPAMAARMAKTILGWPRYYIDRIVKNSSNEVIEDHSGKVIDTFWDEIVGRSMANVEGITRTDAKDILHLVIDLEKHLVKWQHGYLGKDLAGFQNAHTAFMTKWQDVLNKEARVRKNNVKSNYLGLGFVLDQRNLNDNPEFHDDTYTFLIEVAKTPLQDAIAAILMIENSLTQDTYETADIKGVIRTTMFLFEIVAGIIHDMNWIIENHSPVMRTGSKREGYKEPIINSENIHNFDPTKYDNVTHVEAKDLTIVGKVVKLHVPDYRCRVSIITATGWRVEGVSVDGKDTDYTNVNNNEGKVVFLSEKISSTTDKFIELKMNTLPRYSYLTVPQLDVYIVPEQ